MVVSATNGARGWMQRLFPTWPEVGPNTFVLWEPCSRSHGEVVPGYTRYLLDLGYDVLVLMTPARLTEGLFARLDDPRITHGHLSQRQIRRFVRRPELQKAAGVIVTTAGKLPTKEDMSVDLNAVFGPDLPKPLLLVEHDARTRVDAGVWQPDSITLRTLDYRDARSVVVNPHAFGEVSITSKDVDNTVFLMVGAARAKRGNQPLVYEAARALLQAGDDAFEIRVIGKPGKDPVPIDLQAHVNVLGRLSFDEMYGEIEAADFILTSFQKDNEDHVFYRTGGTSGSFQLAYGFGKPIIVQEQFARLSGFDADNSLLYDADDDLVNAMLTAVRMDGATYAGLQDRLQNTARALYAHSLANLKALIRG